ncbi:hypothetical protein SMD22_01100 (plasmid) [Brevibacillus halotolerans]|nr:hypothetical protein SMD22_01100 [Brevibacillus halotolerans]
MVDVTLPSNRAFFHMLRIIESLYFVINEVDQKWDSYPQSTFEIPFRTAFHQLLCILNPLFSKQSDIMKTHCYNDALLKIDNWIQNRGTVKDGVIEESPEIVPLYEYFQNDFWNNYNSIQREQETLSSCSRLHIISTNLRLYAELKQLERELQRYSIYPNAELPLRYVVLDCVECWMHVENKKNNWSNEIKEEIRNSLYEAGAIFFQEHVGFLPQALYHETVFTEIAVEFIRRTDELTLEHRE